MKSPKQPLKGEGREISKSFTVECAEDAETIEFLEMTQLPHKSSVIAKSDISSRSNSE
jgi:hypothetical protein